VLTDFERLENKVSINFPGMKYFSATQGWTCWMLKYLFGNGAIGFNSGAQLDGLKVSVGREVRHMADGGSLHRYGIFRF
jgi:hypothetical protein